MLLSDAVFTLRLITNKLEAKDRTDYMKQR